jgi:hypothetical protein
MLATLLDSSDGSTRAFAGEMVELCRAGLRARSRATAGRGLGRLVADGVCVAVMFWIAWWVQRWVSFQFEPGDGTTPWQLSLLAASLVLALIGYDRIAAAIGFAWIAVANAVSPIVLNHFDATNFTHGPPQVITQDLALFVLLCVMALAPRRRTPDLRRLAWLVPIAAVGWGGSLGAGPAIVAVLAISVVGIATISSDPRLAIAAALWWTAIATPTVLRSFLVSPTWFDPTTTILSLAGPVVLALAALRIRHLQRAAPD